MKKFLFFLIFLMPTLGFTHEAKNPEVKNSELTLSAEGIIHKPADELQIDIGVETISDTAEKALQENSQKMQAVIKNLQTAGLTAKDYNTGQFSIAPTYTPYPKEPPADWKPSINGYQVTNTISIHKNAVDSAGHLIDAANQAGANHINNIRFVLRDSSAAWKEALALATTNAISDAQTIAQSANVKLVRISSIALENNSSAPRPTFYAAKAMNERAIPPIEAGDVTITAKVNITYEISPAN